MYKLNEVIMKYTDQEKKYKTQLLHLGEQLEDFKSVRKHQPVQEFRKEQLSPEIKKAGEKATLTYSAGRVSITATLPNG